MTSSGTPSPTPTAQTPQAPTSVTPTASSSPGPPTTRQTRPPIDIQRLFSTATKYTVFAIFALYSIGFIIWHSYLATYGVSSVAFLQAEYLAAAFCYLFVLVALAVPPVLLINAFRQNIRETG